MIKVWHAKNPNFGMGNLLGLDEPKWPDGYKLVAEIACPDVEVAFSLSQHITDRSWLKGERVVPKIDGDARSTSVGDVLEDDEGNLFRVEMLGVSRFEDGKWIPLDDRTRTWDDLTPPPEN